MPITIFRIAWPYLQRRLAAYGAEYLQKRRERRLAGLRGEIDSPEQAACPPCPPALTLSHQTIWFTVSGVLLGSALGYALAQMIKQE